MMVFLSNAGRRKCFFVSLNFTERLMIKKTKQQNLEFFPKRESGHKNVDKNSYRITHWLMAPMDSLNAFSEKTISGE